MLDVCSASPMALTFKFNNQKVILSLGKLANVYIEAVFLDNQLITWRHSIKYLGVHLLNGNGLSVDIAY